MAVPKKKTSKSKRNMRRGSQKKSKAGLLTIVLNKKTGEPQLPHRLSLKDGHYNGRLVMKKKQGQAHKIEKSE